MLLEIFTQIDYLHSTPPLLQIRFGGAQIKTHLLAPKALADSWKSQLSRFPDAVRLGHPLGLHFWLEFLSDSLVSPGISTASPLGCHIALVIPQPHLSLLKAPGDVQPQQRGSDCEGTCCLR